MKRTAKWLTGIVAVAFLGLVGVWWYSTRVAANKHLIEAAGVVAQFHRNFNSGEYGKICEQSFGCAGKAREDWSNILQRTKSQAGNFVAVRSSKLRAYIEPSSVHAEYVSDFEKGVLVEDFRIKDINENFQIASYKATMNGVPIKIDTGAP